MAGFKQERLSLYTAQGERKYINRAEQHRVAAAMDKLRRERALLGLLLIFTGGRVSELLALRARSFQIDANLVSLITLKRRTPHVREVPIPPALMAAIDQHFHLRELQRDPLTADDRLWRCSRVTVWRFVRAAMLEAGVVGRRACPRALRHGFGVGTLAALVPLNLVQKWMGHADMRTTAIYADASGEEETAFAARFWGTLKAHSGRRAAGNSPSAAKREASNRASRGKTGVLDFGSRRQ